MKERFDIPRTPKMGDEEALLQFQLQPIASRTLRVRLVQRKCTDSWSIPDSLEPKFAFLKASMVSSWIIL